LIHENVEGDSKITDGSDVPHEEQDLPMISITGRRGVTEKLFNRMQIL
jgi:hypothetical protein